MHAARHFAYYAELRAALSILSCVGIGVLDRWNCIVNAAAGLESADDPARSNPLGTHAMAWLALEEWASSPNSGGFIGQSITLRKVAFDDCLNAMWPGNAGRPIAQELILNWGFDLSRVLDDRHARNASSYTAQALNPISSSADETLDFLIEFWSQFEPDAGDPFMQLDRYLFRLMVEAQFKNIGGRPSQLVPDIEKRYEQLEPSIQSVVKKDFLTRNAAGDDPSLIKKARSFSTPSHPTEMISRAALLLRSATAIVTRTLFDAGINTSADLRFWSEAYGENLGFWNAAGPPSPMNELWADVRQAMEDAANVRSSGPSPFSRLDWASSAVNGLPRISETERIALWSLCA